MSLLRDDYDVAKLDRHGSLLIKEANDRTTNKSLANVNNHRSSLICHLPCNISFVVVSATEKRN